MSLLRSQPRPAVRPTALVTNALTDAGLAAAKSLAHAGYRVITADFEGFRFPSRYSSAHYCLPAADLKAFESSLLELLDRLRPQAFLPLGNRSVFVAGKHRDRIAALTIVHVPPFAAFCAAYNRAACMAECARLGIPCPGLYSLEQASRLLAQDRGAVLVVKPDSDQGAASGVRYVRDGAELRAAFGQCQARFGGAFIEEYIPGGAGAMQTVVLLFSPQSRLSAAFTTRKLRQWPPAGGLTAVSYSTAEAPLVKLVLPFFEKWRWCGGAEVELKHDSRDGRDKVIEINPRFPAYLRFPLECGLGLAVMAANPALAGPAGLNGGSLDWASLPRYATGVKYYDPGLVLRALLSRCRSGELSKAGFREDLREMWGAAATLARLLRDPLPLLGRVLASPIFAPHRPPLFQITARHCDALRQERIAAE